MSFPRAKPLATGMIEGYWSTAIKQFFGTAYEAYDSNNQYSGSSPTAPISRVWFTGAQGILTEIYWPRIDTPQVKDSQFLVADGQGFFAEERVDTEYHGSSGCRRAFRRSTSPTRTAPGAS